jgi:hypothetical protein
MEIIVNFGIGNGIYLDDRKPLYQVRLVKELIKKGEDFKIVTFSPYVLEAIEAFKGNVVVKYFNNMVESSLEEIEDEISEAYNLLIKTENL